MELSQPVAATKATVAADAAETRKKPRRPSGCARQAGEEECSDMLTNSIGLPENLGRWATAKVLATCSMVAKA